MECCGNQWNPVEPYVISRSPIISYIILYYPMESCGTLWNHIGSYENLWNPLVPDIIPYHPMESIGLYNPMGSHGML